jgi:DNA-binding LacI/PurR family transcriptional regulator
MLSEIKRFELQKLKIDRIGSQPLYAQINDQLCTLLEQNFAPGDAFYSEQDITRALGVSRITVRRVIDDMDRAGRLIRQPGRKALVAGADGDDRGQAARISGNTRNSTHLSQPVNIHTIVLVGLTWKSEFVLDVVDKLTVLCKLKGLEVKVRVVSDAEMGTFAGTVNSRNTEEAFLLFVGSHYGYLLHKLLSARGYRSVSIDTMTGEYEGNVVSTDAKSAVQIGLSHLIEFGHEKIVLLVNEPIIHESVVDKIVEFKNIAHEKGLNGRVVIAGGLPGIDAHDAAYMHMPEVWPDGDLRPTAIMTVSDPGAWAAQKWLREQGVKIPNEVSVLGFENARSSSHVAPPLTTIAHPVQDIIERAVEILVNPESTGSSNNLPINETIKPTLILRESTGPAPK